MRHLSPSRRSFTPRVLVVLAGLLSSTLAQFESVSIVPTYPHSCVNTCVYAPPGGINYGLKCGEPVGNRCYCATNSAAVTRIDSFVSACVTEYCSAGDISDDLVAIKSIYASYCMGAGFTAPVISNWYTPAKTTSGSEPTAQSTGQDTPTRTQSTAVTQTSPISNSGPSLTQVAGQTTSTRGVDSQGTGASFTVGDPDLAKKLGIGLGVGVPPLVVAIAIGVWLCLRKRRRSRAQAKALPAQSSTQHAPFTTQPAELGKSQTVIASATPPSELAGDPGGVRGELRGREIHPFPATSDEKSPVVVPR